MGRGGEFETAADHRAMQHGDHRHFAELDALEGAMPGPRVFDAGKNVALDELGQIEAGAEMLAVAGEHDGADIAPAAHVKKAPMPRTVWIVERVAFCRAIEPQHRDRAAPLRA